MPPPARSAGTVRTIARACRVAPSSQRCTVGTTSAVTRTLFTTLSGFVAADVTVNGERAGLDAYIAGLQDVVRPFPDYRWHLEELLIDAPWIAARLTDTGTHRAPFLGVAASGRTVTTHELAHYRLEAGRFAEVWVTADDMRLLDQLR